MSKKINPEQYGVTIRKKAFPWKEIAIAFGAILVIGLMSIAMFYISKNTSSGGTDTYTPIINVGSSIDTGTSLDEDARNATTSTYTGSGAVYTKYYDSGSGTAASPYIITNANTLMGLALACQSSSYSTYTSGKYFKLGGNIDMNGYSLIFGLVSGAYSTTYNFLGASFDGNGYTISDITISSSVSSTTRYLGIFPYISKALTISNLTLTGVSVTGYNTYASSSHKYNYFGGLIGYASAAVTITGCYFDLDVYDKTISSYCSSSYYTYSYVGGLIGRKTAALTISYSQLVLTAESTLFAYQHNIYVGGVVGFGTYAITMNYCYLDVYAYGYSYNYSTNSIFRAYVYVGGVLGFGSSYAAVTMNYCYIDSYVYARSVDSSTSYTTYYGGSYAGGVVGYIESGTTYTVSLTQCYVFLDYVYGYSRRYNTSSSYSAYSWVGGVVGYNTCTLNITDTFITSDSAITATYYSSCSSAYAGGIVGYRGNGVTTLTDSLLVLSCSGVSGSSPYVATTTSTSYVVINTSYYDSTVYGSTSYTGYKTTTNCKANLSGFSITSGDNSDNTYTWMRDTTSTINSGYPYPKLGYYATYISGFYVNITGTGTSSDPYCISTKLALQCLEYLVRFGFGATYTNGKYFKLTADIDMEDSELTIGSTTITTAAYQFQGVEFDGNDKTISNIYTDSTGQYVALFPYLSTNNLTIKDLYIENATYTTSSTINPFAGTLIGYTSKTITITDCYIDSEVSVSHTSSSASKNSFVGGMIGRLATGYLYVNNCHLYVKLSNTNVYGTSYSGGVVGYIATHMELENIYMECEIQVTNPTSSSIHTGGFVGYLADVSATKNTTYFLTNCIALPTITDISGSNTGPFVGYDPEGELTIKDSYYNTYVYLFEENGLAACARTSTELKTPANYPSTWGSISLLDDTSAEWGLFYAVNDGYPYVKSVIDISEIDIETFKYGEGTEENPYEIGSLTELVKLQSSVNDYGVTFAGVYFIVTANIDITTLDWQPIGYSSSLVFSGNINGKGKTIQNLKISSNYDYAGLFGYLDNATIYDLSVTCTLLKTQQALGTGVFAGRSDNSTLTNINVSGTIERSGSSANSSYIGGMIGSVYGGTITNCSADVDITDISTYGAVGVGGMFGYSSGAIISSVVNSTIIKVTATNGSPYTVYVGGLVGQSINNNFKTIDTYANLDVNSAATYVGGVAAFASGSYFLTVDSEGVVNTSAVTGYVGGFTGYLTTSTVTTIDTLVDIDTSSTITYLGGFTGQGQINTYTNIIFDGNMASVGTVTYLGGAVGYTTNETFSLVVSDLIFTQSSAGKSTYLSAFAGYADRISIATSDLDTTMTIAGTTVNLGGFFGYTVTGSLKSSTITGSITENTTSSLVNFGSIAGYTYGQTITDVSSTCNMYSNTTATTARYVGGMVGQQRYGTDLTITGSSVEIELKVFGSNIYVYTIGSIVSTATTATYIVDIYNLSTSYAYIDMFTTKFVDTVVREYGY